VNCDRIARWYRWIEYAGFGRALERRRKAFLTDIADARRGLTVLEALMRGCPAVSYGWGRGHVRVNNAAFRRFGLPVNPLTKLCVSADEMIAHYRAIEAQRATLGYDIDGVVYKVNDLTLQQRLGFAPQVDRAFLGFGSTDLDRVARPVDPEPIAVVVDRLFVADHGDRHDRNPGAHGDLDEAAAPEAPELVAVAVVLAGSLR